jgi:dTDP-4-dehydrorhamnose reductase
MNVLVIGATGFLGSHIYKQLSSEGMNVSGTYYRNQKPGLKRLNITNKEEVKEFFEENKPDLVVDCGGIVGYAACKVDPARAHEVNVDATGYIADACKENNAKLVYISTASVFDGSKGSPYIENDTTKPLDAFYGGTNAEGEKKALELDGAVVVRLMKLIGWSGSGGSFAEKAVAGNCGFFDTTKLQYTLVDDVTKLIKRIAEKPIEFEGIYHLSSRDGYTQYELAKQIREGLCIDENTNPITKMEDTTPGPNIVFDLKEPRKGIEISTLEETIHSLRKERELSLRPEGVILSGPENK